MRSTAALIGFALLLVGGLARAQTSPAKQVDQGVAEYEDLEYEKAITTLRGALGNKAIAKPDRVRAHRYEALSLLALNRREEARAAFLALLKIDRTFTLPRSESKAARDMLEDVRRTLPKPKAVVGVTQVEVASGARAGDPVNVTIGVSDPARAHRTVAVLHRVGGKGSYSTVQAASTGGGLYLATIPGTSTRAGILELYVVVSGDAGVVLAKSSTRSVRIEPRPIAAPSARRPIYKRWWFWAAVGVAATAGTGAYLLIRSDDNGQRAGVTVSFDFGQL